MVVRLLGWEVALLAGDSGKGMQASCVGVVAAAVHCGLDMSFPRQRPRGDLAGKNRGRTFGLTFRESLRHKRDREFRGEKKAEGSW